MTWVGKAGKWTSYHSHVCRFEKTCRILTYALSFASSTDCRHAEQAHEGDFAWRAGTWIGAARRTCLHCLFPIRMILDRRSDFLMLATPTEPNDMEQGIEDGIAQRVAKELRAKISEELDSLRQSALNAGSFNHHSGFIW